MFACFAGVITSAFAGQGDLDSRTRVNGYTFARAGKKTFAATIPLFPIFTCFRFGISMSSFQVRPATLRDAKAIAQIHTASATEAYRGLVPDDQLKSMSSVEKRQAYWREAIEYCEPQVQVAIDGDKIVGFVGFDRSRDEKSRPTTGEIWAIYAAPSHWGQGVGVTLWDAARDGLAEEGCTNVTAWVPLRNERALRFHEMAGFKREMSTAKTAVIGGIKIEEVRLKRPLN